MLLPPGHPALLLLAGILLAAAAQDAGYQMTQPESLSAPAGGSVTLPCSFTYPHEIEPLRDLRVYWRLGFHGQFIYNHTERFTRRITGAASSWSGTHGGTKRLDPHHPAAEVGRWRVRLPLQGAEERRPMGPMAPSPWDPAHGDSPRAISEYAPCTERTMTQGATQRPAGQGAAPVIGGGAGGGRPAGRDHRAGCVRRPEETRRSAEGPPGPEGTRPVTGRRRVHGHRGRSPRLTPRLSFQAGCLPRAPAPPGPPGPRLALRCPGLHRDRRCPAAARPPRGPHGRDPLLSRPGAL
ncbi:unnamed protein product, partial [Lepidochelys kempii]